MTTDTPTQTVTDERADILDALTKHRGLFRFTVVGLSDEQARLTPTVSALSLGGLVKHVSAVEQTWATFVTDGPAEHPGGPPGCSDKSEEGHQSRRSSKSTVER